MEHGWQDSVEDRAWRKGEEGRGRRGRGVGASNESYLCTQQPITAPVAACFLHGSIHRTKPLAVHNVWALHPQHDCSCPGAVLQHPSRPGVGQCKPINGVRSHLHKPCEHASKDEGGGRRGGGDACIEEGGEGGGERRGGGKRSVRPFVCPRVRAEHVQHAWGACMCTDVSTAAWKSVLDGELGEGGVQRKGVWC